MKPNFALSLSLDGIVLLHRSAAGWRIVGEADPASDTLAEELAVLRRTATAMASGGLRCKLVIPNDQIKYLSVETPGLVAQERRAAARSALQDATPYAVEQLEFDIHVDGDLTHVAAVAQETLAEAESFAMTHRFHPVCFVARPDLENAFGAEPFFGVTQAAADLLAPGETVERDGTALLLTASEEVPETESDVVNAPDIPLDAPEDEDNDPVEEPSFVSRRRVPTFRTETDAPVDAYGATAGSVPGFGEPAAPFAGPEYPPATPARPRMAVPAPAPVVRKTASEKERLTIYGAHAGSGFRNRMGAGGALVLGAVVVAAGVAAFSGGAGREGLARLTALFSNPEPAVQFTAPVQPQQPATQLRGESAETEVQQTEALEMANREAPAAAGLQAGRDLSPEDSASIDLATLTPELSDEDAAVLDALRAPVIEAPAPAQAPTIDDPRAAYAVTGIWPVAPEVPSPPALVDIDGLYVTSIDPINPNFDAVALPALSSQTHDLGFLALASPAPAGTVFELDARGLVIATPQGRMNPDGVMVFAGPPPVQPPANLVKAEDPGEDLALRLRLSGTRPQARPEDLIETSERAAFSGLTRSELGEIRPRLRPQSAQENALASASLASLDTGNSRSLLEQPDNANVENATIRAIAASLRPDARPRDFDRTVANAIEQAAPAPTPAPRVASAPRNVTPTIPSSASVSREATVKNAISLRRVNLIGVYGKPSNRRALVRMENGSYRKVEVGDRIDGGQVSVIGDSELHYQKSGRSIVLKMPRG